MRQLLVLPLVAAAAGCGPDFAPYNRLESLRVLAVRADPPTPAFGETAALSALVYAPPELSYTASWSWCPFTLGALDGYACAVEEADLQATIDANLPPGVSFSLPSFDLGDAAVASLTNVFVPELLDAACRELVAGGLPPGVPVPDCGRGLPVNIRLEVRGGGQAVVAVKELVLRGTSEVANLNPVIDDLLAGASDGPRAPLAPDGSTELARGASVDLELTLDPAEAEVYDDATGESRSETLLFTWFVEGGETEVTRTAFATGRSDLAAAARNTWTVPLRAELARESALVVVVARDDRGGAGWIERRVRLGEE